jgi:hypothetical protein
MKTRLLFFVFISMTLVYISCKKEEAIPTDHLNLLTNHIWTADSLLADGVDEGGAGGLLEKFNGDTKFNEDGTGYVGEIVGNWQFTNNENALIITSDSLQLAVSANIEELTAQSLKLTTAYPIQTSPTVVYAAVRMTFIPK